MSPRRDRYNGEREVDRRPGGLAVWPVTAVKKRNNRSVVGAPLSIGVPPTIPRSITEGPTYVPWWRYLVFQAYVAELAGASHFETVLSQLIGEEKDYFLRQLLRWHGGQRCVIGPSISYALKCYQHRDTAPMGASLAAMVIAERTAREIAAQVQIPLAHVIVFLKLFFDIRCCRSSPFWLADLCYSSAAAEWLGKTARRRLITAFERGWPGFHATFGKAGVDETPPGRRAQERFILGLVNRLGDGVRALEMNGTDPSPDEAALLPQFLERSLPPEILQFTYPAPLTAEQIQKRAEAAKVVGALPAASRRKISALLDRVVLAVSADADPQDGGNARSQTGDGKAERP